MSIMSSRGQTETQKLKQNLEEQLHRLVAQLADLEECREELEDDEYEDTKNETLEQLKEVGASLDKMVAGNITLVNHVNAMQLAIQAAISQAFRTPEVIRMFARKQPDQLRQKLAELERDAKVGTLSSDALLMQKLEILTALKTLQASLTPEELNYLQQHSTLSLKGYEVTSEDYGSGSKILEMAGSEISQTQT